MYLTSGSATASSQLLELAESAKYDERKADSKPVFSTPLDPQCNPMFDARAGVLESGEMERDAVGPPRGSDYVGHASIRRTCAELITEMIGGI